MKIAKKFKEELKLANPEKEELMVRLDDLNKKDTIVSIDLFNACETLRKELSKSLKIAKKFKEELKLANLEKEELIVRLDESNKNNELWKNQFSFQDEKFGTKVS